MISLSHNQFSYLIVTASYWTFMLSDGALRMLVLLHFHQNGFSPLQLAYLFLFYELAGIFTNLTAGWLATKFGLKFTLTTGLTIQILSLYLLSQLNEDWSHNFSVLYVLIVQGLSGVAKDLTKMSSKSAVKLLAPENNMGLFRWVAILTGSKNTIKGLGFLVGSVLLATLGFYKSLLCMLIIVSLILIMSVYLLKNDLFSTKKNIKFADIFSKSKNINFLSVARVFLFGARDVWFVVGLPVFFYNIFSDGTTEGKQSAFYIVGSIMALWVILYGLVQASSPRLFQNKENKDPDLIQISKKWVFYLFVNIISITLLFLIINEVFFKNLVLFLGLFIFCFIFAVNSSVHSFLILKFSKKKDVTLDVGFYYMANATGRLLGTFLSGYTFQVGGLMLSLTVASAMIGLCFFFTFFINENNENLEN